MPVGHPPLICKSAAPKGGWVGFSCAFYEESESCRVLRVCPCRPVLPARRPSLSPAADFFFSGHDLSAGLRAALEESLTPSSSMTWLLCLPSFSPGPLRPRLGAERSAASSPPRPAAEVPLLCLGAPSSSS